MGRRAETGAGSLYWFFRGELRRLFSGISIINSIAFSPDGRAAWFADTALGIIWRIATDPATGLPQGERQVFATIPAGEGGPDGRSEESRVGKEWVRQGICRGSPYH